MPSLSLSQIQFKLGPSKVGTTWVCARCSLVEEKKMYIGLGHT